MAPESYLIGIAGPSGAGKSFLARHVADKVHAPVLSLDHYYRDLSHLSWDERDRTNFDEPAALEHELLIGQVGDLSARRAIAVPTYDFSFHTRTRETQLFQPATFVIIEGLFTLHWLELRRLLGTTVYVDTTDEVCLQRRTRRDVKERGRTLESVAAQFRATVAPMAERYVRPTLQYADVVVSGSLPIERSVAQVLDHVRQEARRHNMRSALDHLEALELASAH
jgi:uridine kinase